MNGGDELFRRRCWRRCLIAPHSAPRVFVHRDEALNLFTLVTEVVCHWSCALAMTTSFLEDPETLPFLCVQSHRFWIGKPR